MRVKNGFSLLEIVIATFIFLLMVTTLSSMFAVHARAQMRSGNLLVAADLADLEMERTLALGYHDAHATTGTYTQTWEVRGVPVTHTYTTRVNITVIIDPTIPVGGGYLPGFKVVEVTVEYDDANGSDQKKTHTIKSYMADDA